MSDRLNEAIRLGELSLAEYRDEIGGEAAPTIRTLLTAARAYADLVNGERVEPDYEAATKEMVRRGFYTISPEMDEEYARAIVLAAIGDRLLIDPPKEEE